MRTPLSDRSGRLRFLARCAVVGALMLVPLACKSSRDAQVTTSAAASTTSTSSSTSTPASTSTSSTSTTLPPTTTTTTIPLITEGGVVKVANASGIDGAAASLTAELAALGFATSGATNAAGIDKGLDASKIYVTPGSEAVAESVSRIMGELPISPMPTPAWISGGTAGLGDATVLVMLGHDRAGTALADMT